MSLVIAIHTISKKTRNIEPKTAFEIDDATELAVMLKLGAVREATDAEIKLYRMSHPVALAESDPVAPVAPAPPPVAAASAGPSRADLESRALKAGVTFRSTLSDEKLLERVTEAESMLPESDPDVVQNPTLDI